jgi:hypothetical protein
MASADSNNKNSFKKLVEIEESQLPQPSPQTERNVLGTARKIGFIGNVIELYLSKALGMISSLFGGSDLPAKKEESTQDLLKGNFDNDYTIEPGGRAT